MGYIHVAAALGLVVALFGVPARCQSSSSSDSNMPTWKLVAIIVPSVVGGLTLLTCLYFCCCYRRGTSRGLCGDCADCGGTGGCANGCGDCCDHGAGCCDCGGCCYDNRRPAPPRAVYSSSQGPITVQEAVNYRSAPPPQPVYRERENTYFSSIPVTAGYGGGVYGEPPRQGGIYGGPPRIGY